MTGNSSAVMLAVLARNFAKHNVQRPGPGLPSAGKESGAFGQAISAGLAAVFLAVEANVRPEARHIFGSEAGAGMTLLTRRILKARSLSGTSQTNMDCYA